MPPSQSSKDVPIRKVSSVSNVLSIKDNNILTNSNLIALRCTSNFEDTMFEMEAHLNEHTKAPEYPKDSEIDILGHTTVGDIRPFKENDSDATEYSSSFSGTISGAENSEHSDAEVESRFCGDNYLAPPFDVFKNIFESRKKSTTDHWKNFIHPLMWRCKWMELRIKEMESQAMKYASKLVKYDQRKQLDAYNQYILDDGCSKAFPFSNQHHKKRVMKRRKRKRVEDVTDPTSYILTHNLFQYLENKGDPDVPLKTDETGNSVVMEQNVMSSENVDARDEQSVFEFGDSDNSLEKILSKIQMLHSRVQKLKDRLEMVISKNAISFSLENLSIPEHCHPSPPPTAGNGDAIESTVDLSSATDVTLNETRIRDSSEIVINNVEIVKESEQIENPTLGINEQQSSVKPCLDVHFPKNKRRRVDRKPGLGGSWNQKKPDSQN